MNNKMMIAGAFWALLAVLGTSSAAEIYLETKTYEVQVAENVTRQENNINRLHKMSQD